MGKFSGKNQIKKKVLSTPLTKWALASKFAFLGFDAGWSSLVARWARNSAELKIMSTKLKGDIAEQAAVLHALKRGWEVLKPIGDRSPYDLIFGVNKSFIKVRVKSAWYDRKRLNYVVDNRRTKTNRRQMVRSKYEPSDFDFALLPGRFGLVLHFSC